MSQEMPQDLKDLVASVQAIKTVHELLNQGVYPGYVSKAVTSSVVFIEELHKQSFEKLKAHPEYETFYPSKEQEVGVSDVQ